MIHRGQNLRFALKPAEAIGIIREVIGQQLDRHIPLKARVSCAKDDTHSAFTQW
jgi:hypothetical protein